MALVNEITSKTGSKDDMVTLHLDTMGFAVKPGEEQEDKDNTVRRLMSRTSRNIVTITKEELVDKILHGYSIIPGVCPMSEERKKEKGGGSKQEDFVEQQIWALDFDSAIDKGSKESHMDEIIERLTELGISPFFVYSSFSDGKFLVDRNVEKFRVVFATKDIVTDIEFRDKLQATLMGLFCEQIDKSCKNRNRYYNGTRSDARVYLDYEAVVDANAVLENYWDDKYKEFFPGGAKSTKKGNGSPKELPYCDASKKRRSSSLYELMPIEEFPDVFPKVRNGLIKYDMQLHCEEYLGLVEAALEENEYVEGTGRRSIIFDVFNMISFKEGTRKAYSKCFEINERFVEPLSIREFNACTWNALEHIEKNCADLHKTQFVYRYDTLIDRLGVADDVKEDLNYFKNKRAKEEADRLRPIKEERDEVIRYLYEDGKSSREIAKVLKEMYGKDSKLAISDRAIRKYIEKAYKKVGTFGTITLYNSSFLPNNNQFFFSEEDSIYEERAEFDHTEDLETLSEDSRSTLNEGQERAFDDALEGYNLFITGGAGTGKSYLVKNILTRLRLNGKSVAVCAASALAASAYEDGMTFHRLFGYTSKGIVYPQVLERLAEYDVIVIEEVGMLGKSTMDFLGLAMCSLYKQYGNTPQIILVGDVLQLPPIEKRYFFESKWYKCFNFVPHYLIENIRQRGAEAFFCCLNRLRLGVDNHEEINRICQHNEVSDEIYLMPTNSKAEAKNRECLERVEGELIDLGNGQFVKIGAKVICNKNKYKDGVLQYYNGLQGTVVRVSPKKRVVTIRDSKGNLVRISRCEIEEDGRLLSKFPILLGYAITIHKSQGMTLECANVDPASFASGQLYVALSRVKTAEGVHLLRNVKKKDIKKLNSEAFKFDEKLRVQCGIKTVVEEMEYNNERE